MTLATSANPFPGLRPFEADEDHFYFGRERETDELLRRLRANRFLAVVGSSGSGKSSLVRCGLIPSLQSGFMVTAGSSWRVAIVRPGEDPVAHLAAALDAPDALGARHDELGPASRILLEATLRRGTLGLVDAVRQARIPSSDNVLVVVDQFEELFRYRRQRQLHGAADDAVGFVKLLLEAAGQTAVPIYVVLTMRSDFLGECMQYPGLPEAVNEGLYLVPRMTRDNLRAAITGPIAVAGGEITPRLVLRLLNEVGDDPDTLPVLQHALLRTWDHWHRCCTGKRPIDIEDFEAIGALGRSLSLHAEEAFNELEPGRSRRLAEQIFKALTDTFAEPRGTRRPTSVAELAALCEADAAEIIGVVEVFRRPGRSFLTPLGDVPLTSRSIIDLSHESLMRGWTRLVAWASEERQAAGMYARVSQAATWWRDGSAGLWRDPELELGLRWRRETKPTAAWARRYGESFEQAMAFLDRSEQEQRRVEAERDAERRRKLRQAQWAAAVLGALLVMALISTWVAWRESARAARNFTLAREAVDETLSSASLDPSRVGADVPELVAFRRDLMRKAERFYAEFVLQEPGSEALLSDVAEGHRRLGHIQRLLDEPVAAEHHYHDAIKQFERLAAAHPSEPAYRRALADTHNWLGETLRSIPGRADAAEAAYSTAAQLQQRLVEEGSDRVADSRDLARSYYNRGILLASRAKTPADAAFRDAEAALRQAIGLLEPLAATHANRQALQELARARNNLGTHVAADAERLAEVEQLYEQAIVIHEELRAADRANREYAIELAKFYNNMAYLLSDRQQPERAIELNDRALGIFEELSRPAMSVGIEQADSHTLRGRLLESRNPRQAYFAYRRSYQMFESLERREHVSHPSDFQRRFVDLLVNVAVFARQRGAPVDARRLLVQATESYLRLGREVAFSGSPSEVDLTVDYLSTLWQELAEPERKELLEPYTELRRQLQKRVAAPQAPHTPASTPGREP
jgi:tetratricopeptide (TPR) repeat protein/energy-coupling factor transporter ATP-binding protein EcfA2